MSKTIGPYRLNPRGDYNPAADPLYSLLDLVSDGGGSFVYINDTPSNEPTSSASHWQQIASMGGQDLVDAAVAAKNVAQAQAVLAQGYAAQLAAGLLRPKGTYADLAALNAGTPTVADTDEIYITLDDGKWCYHNGVAWVAGGQFQAASVVGDIANLTAQLTEIERVTGIRQVNLIDTQTAASRIENAAGSVSTGLSWSGEDGYVVCDSNLNNDGRRLMAGQKIPVAEGDKLTISADIMFGLSATSYRFIIGLEDQYTTKAVSDAQGNWIRISHTMTVDSSTAAVNGARLLLQAESPPAVPLYIKNIQVEYGESATLYLPYGVKQSSVMDSVPVIANASEKLYKSEKGFSYITSNAHVSYTENSATGVSTITFEDTLVFRGYSNFSVVLTQADVLAALPDNSVAYGTKGYTISIPYGSALCINLTDATLVIRSAVSIQVDDYMVAYNGYGNISGEIIQKCLMIDNELNKARIDSLESFSGEASGDALNAIQRFTSKFVDATTKSDSFLWFTDPHLFEGTNYKAEMMNRLSVIEKTYNNAPISFAVCGGDWIGNSDTKESACYKLGCVDARMRRMFRRYYHCVGNHDTNEQGKLTPESENWTGEVSEQTLVNLWNRDQGANYYSFNSAGATFYVLDSFREGQAMNAYRWVQIDWLSAQLKEDDAENSAIMMHIIFINSEDVIGAFANNVVSLITAYNLHGSVTLNGIEYDFSSCAGKVRFILSGHVHRDTVVVQNGIPLIATSNVRAISGASSLPTFDLAYADWGAGKLHLVRIGSGSDQEIYMA